LRAVDWRNVPLLALVVIATATSYGNHRLLLAQRDLIEHTYEIIWTLEASLQQVTDAETVQHGHFASSIFLTRLNGNAKRRHPPGHKLLQCLQWHLVA
jgi:hypothetical protein